MGTVWLPARFGPKQRIICPSHPNPPVRHAGCDYFGWTFKPHGRSVEVFVESSAAT
jgi:hypothetical protein